MKGTSLFAAIIALLVGFTAYDYWSSQKKDEAKAAQEKVVRIDKQQLKVIEVEGTKNAFRLEKKDDHWNLTKPYQESADQQVVLSYIDQLFGESSISEVADGSDLSKYGLKEPLFTLHLIAEREERVKLGSVRAYDSSLYVQVDSEPHVLLVNSSWDVLLSKLPSEFRDPKLYHGPATNDFESMKLSGPNGFEFSRIDGKYVLKGAPEPVYQESVRIWLEQIKALRGAAFVEKPVGTFKADTTLTLTRKDAAPFVLQVARDLAHPGQFEATSTDLPGGMKSRVLVSPRALEPVIVKSEVFYSKKAPFEFDVATVAQVKFYDAGKTVDTKVDPAKPDPLITKISQLEAVRFMGPISREKKFPSHLTLLKSDGSTVFEMWWGEAVSEKAAGDKPEVRYIPVKTNLSKQLLGVPEKSIADLGN